MEIRPDNTQVDSLTFCRTEDRNSVNLDSGEMGGMVASSNKVRRRRKCVWITSIISGLIAITIIAVTIKSRLLEYFIHCSVLIKIIPRHQLRSVAEALVRRSNGSDGAVKDDRNKINFHDYLSYKFYPKSFNGSWISDTEIMYLNQFGSLVIYNVETRDTQQIMPYNIFLQLHPISYEFSADRKYLLIKQLSQPVWRRSSFGSYVLLKFVNGRPLTNKLISLQPSSVVRISGGELIKVLLTSIVIER